MGTGGRNSYISVTTLITKLAMILIAKKGLYSNEIQGGFTDAAYICN
jgi:hypothetical protein